MHQLRLAQTNADDDDLVKPSAELAESIAEETAQALAKVRETKASASKLSLAIESIKRNDKYIRYIPDEAAPGYNPLCAERVIRLVERQVDPLEPARFKSRRAPHAKTEEPAPLERAPPKKLTPEDQAAWKIPPCVSNWKNQQGYTIPLDMRLQADGRGLQEVTVNSGFAQFSEALYVAERLAREEIRMKNDLVKQKKQMEEADREERLREIAAKARAERSQLLQTAPEPKEKEKEEVPSPSSASPKRRRSPSPVNRQTTRSVSPSPPQRSIHSRRRDSPSQRRDSPSRRRDSPSPPRMRRRSEVKEEDNSRGFSNGPPSRLRSLSKSPSPPRRQQERSRAKQESHRGPSESSASSSRRSPSPRLSAHRSRDVSPSPKRDVSPSPVKRSRSSSSDAGSSRALRGLATKRGLPVKRDSSESPRRRRQSLSPSETHTDRRALPRRGDRNSSRSPQRRPPSPSRRPPSPSRRPPSPSPPLKLDKADVKDEKPGPHSRSPSRRSRSPSPRRRGGVSPIRRAGPGRRFSSPRRRDVSRSPLRRDSRLRRRSFSPSPPGRRIPRDAPRRGNRFSPPNRFLPSARDLSPDSPRRPSVSPSPRRGVSPSPRRRIDNSRNRNGRDRSPVRRDGSADSRDSSRPLSHRRRRSPSASASPQRDGQSPLRRRASPSPVRHRSHQRVSPMVQRRDRDESMQRGPPRRQLKRRDSPESSSSSDNHQSPRRRPRETSLGDRRRDMSHGDRRRDMSHGDRRRDMSHGDRRRDMSPVQSGREESMASDGGKKNENKVKESRRPVDALDEVERERRREIERELRLERAGAKRRRLVDDKDRDISEKIALGQAQTTMQEDLFDARLFNRETAAVADITVADDDEYALYDKPLFADRSKARRFL